MLFADDIVLCSTRRGHVEMKLEEWRTAMEERGLKISRRKTEYLTSTDVRGRDMGVEEGTGKEIGGRRNENATMDVRSYETGQDQK